MKTLWRFLQSAFVLAAFGVWGYSVGYTLSRLLHPLPVTPVCSECHCKSLSGWCCCKDRCKPKCDCENCTCASSSSE